MVSRASASCFVTPRKIRPPSQCVALLVTVHLSQASDAANREKSRKEEEERLAKLNDRVQQLQSAHEQSASSLAQKERELEGELPSRLRRRWRTDARAILFVLS